MIPDEKEVKTMDRVLSIVLRTGLTLSLAIIIFGGILYFLHNGTIGIDSRAYLGEPAPPGSFIEMAQQARQGDGTACVYLGIVLLIATPVVRVFFCGLIFLFEKDRFYVCASAVVLALLLYSLL